MRWHMQNSLHCRIALVLEYSSLPYPRFERSPARFFPARSEVTIYERTQQHKKSITRINTRNAINRRWNIWCKTERLTQSPLHIFVFKLHIEAGAIPTNTWSWSSHQMPTAWGWWIYWSVGPTVPSKPWGHDSENAVTFHPASQCLHRGPFGLIWVSSNV